MMQSNFSPLRASRGRTLSTSSAMNWALSVAIPLSVKFSRPRSSDFRERSMLTVPAPPPSAADYGEGTGVGKTVQRPRRRDPPDELPVLALIDKKPDRIARSRNPRRSWTPRSRSDTRSSGCAVSPERSRGASRSSFCFGKTRSKTRFRSPAPRFRQRLSARELLAGGFRFVGNQRVPRRSVRPSRRTLVHSRYAFVFSATKSRAVPKENPVVHARAVVLLAWGVRVRFRSVMARRSGISADFL